MSLILHVPHDSIEIPNEYRQDFLLDDDALAQEIIAMTDMHTNDLYQCNDGEKVIFPVSRLLCDPERFDDDSQEIMAERGMGVLYVVTSTLSPLREKLSVDKRQDILDRYYYPHHKKLTEAVSDKLTIDGKCLIVDCHSFPSRPLPYELKDSNDLRCEICIGTDSFHTPNNVKDALYGFFIEKGYSVSIDDPFAGALVPMDFYQKNRNVMSVMYEVRRDLYMNEKTGERTGRFDEIKNDLSESMELLEKIVTH